jgi:hypothetical protein
MLLNLNTSTTLDYLRIFRSINTCYSFAEAENKTLLLFVNVKRENYESSSK